MTKNDTPQPPDGDDELDKLLWEFQIYVELHTPGMLILLDKKREETEQAIRTKYISREQVEATINKLPIFGHVKLSTGIRTDYISVNDLRRELGLQGEIDE